MTTSRRHLLGGAAALAAAWVSGARAAEVDLNLPGGGGVRPLIKDYPQKGAMILQRTRPPLLETPFEVFDEGTFTPNNRFYVRWHWAVIPTEVDVNAFRLEVKGHVNAPLSLTLRELYNLPRVELAAVNQCSGNSRGLFQPRVPGAQWGNGAMGNAKWVGVRLRDVLDRAGVRAGATVVRFGALDQPVVQEGPDFMKSLALDHARDGEVMIAYLMNGEPMTLNHGFPIRLIVPGWFSTYWVKALNSIEVLDGPDENYWMKTAYRIPDTPGANVRPGQTGFGTVPINRMVPRSFVTNLADGAAIPAGRTALRGIAFDGGSGIARVEVSADGGQRWTDAALGEDHGRYSFRGFEAVLRLPPGAHRLMSRATGCDGGTQPMEARWNPAGYMRNVVETVTVKAA